MKLRIFLPAHERADAALPFAWILLDGRGNVLREDATPLGDVPRADSCEAMLPASRVLFARLALPRVGNATLRELLPFAVEDRLLADPAHIHAVAGGRNAAGETVVAVVDREWLQAMLDALRRAGLRVTQARPESALVPRQAGTWDVVWSGRGGLLVDDDGVAATFDHDATGALPLALRLALDEAAERDRRPASVRLHVQGPSHAPDLARWTNDTGVPFEAGSRWEELARGEPQAPIELLSGEFVPRRRTAVRLPRAALVLAAAIALLQLAFVALDAARLGHERRRLEGEREALFREAFPEAKVVVDPDLQMRRNLADLRRTRGLAVEDDFLGRLSRAAREPGGPARSIEYASGKLTLQRGAPGAAQASR
ncbi:MAG TPA: type II secretion system protein GspL [Usitatibacter sp.]|nr:type II secretion system protein GspL [Usitatibacter sp.]